MIKEKEGAQREFYLQNILEKMKKAHESLASPRLYMERRAEEILMSMCSRGDLFSVGLEEIYTREILEGREIGKTVVVAVWDDAGLAEV
jgi:hypothetical protein